MRIGIERLQGMRDAAENKHRHYGIEGKPSLGWHDGIRAEPH